jgi:hypothetical protein
MSASWRSPNTRADSQDQNRTFRTRLVIAWLLSNAGLAIVISSINGLDQTKLLVEACLPAGDKEVDTMNRTCITQALSLDAREVQSKQQEYFKYLLWATFGLSAVRFIGVSLFSFFLLVCLMDRVRMKVTRGQEWTRADVIVSVLLGH